LEGNSGLIAPWPFAKPETQKTSKMASIDKLDPPSYLSGTRYRGLLQCAQSGVARFDFTALKQTQMRSEVGVGSVAWGLRRQGGASHPLSTA